MSLRAAAAVLLFALLIAPAAGAAEAPIATLDYVAIARSAGEPEMNVAVTAPAQPRGKLPVILFSHGAYLSRFDYGPLVRALARDGFVVLQPDHPDAGGAKAGPENWRTRIEDLQRLSRSLDAIEAATPRLRGRLDREHVFAVGHSLGAHSVVALMGAGVWDARIGAFSRFDAPAIKAAVLLSPPGLGGDALVPAWRERGGYMKLELAGLHGPLLIVAGQDDTTAVLSDRGPAWHQDYYRRSEAHGLCLAVLKRARHFLGGVADPARRDVDDADPVLPPLVERLTATFLRRGASGGGDARVALLRAQDPDAKSLIECR